MDPSAPWLRAAPPRAGGATVAPLLVLLAVGAVVIGQLAWTANALLRDEDAFTALLHGAFVREPLRGEVADDIAEDLAEAGLAVVADAPGGLAARPDAEQTLRTAARAVVDSPVLDAELEVIARFAAMAVVSGETDQDVGLEHLWDAYIAAVGEGDADLAGAMRAMAPPDSAALEELAAGPGDPPAAADGQGEQMPALEPALAWLPATTLMAYVVAFAGSIGAVALARSRGRGTALAVALPALVTLVVWAVSGGDGIPSHILRTVASAALPAAAVTGTVALAALLTGLRAVAAGEQPLGGIPTSFDGPPVTREHPNG